MQSISIRLFPLGELTTFGLLKAANQPRILPLDLKIHF
jgi:hypothetical protein